MPYPTEIASTKGFLERRYPSKAGEARYVFFGRWDFPRTEWSERTCAFAEGTGCIYDRIRREL